MSRGILREIGKNVYGTDYTRIIKSMDIIGDIAIIKIPPELLDERRFEFAKEIMKRMKYIRVVLRQVTPVEGVLRIRKFEYLAGEDRRETIYKEHGALYKLNVEKVYFTPRLSNERLRISRLAREGEVIINMFAGVGPYSILIAKNLGQVLVHSIDINPYAVEYHLANNLLNSVEDKIVVYRGDAADIIKKKLLDSADRVLMPLPEYAIQYLDYAVSALKERGYLHIYLHIPYKHDEKEALITSEQIVTKELSKRKFDVIYIKSNRVREVATRTLQVCVDVYIKKN